MHVKSSYPSPLVFAGYNLLVVSPAFFFRVRNIYFSDLSAVLPVWYARAYRVLLKSVVLHAIQYYKIALCFQSLS